MCLFRAAGEGLPPTSAEAITPAKKPKAIAAQRGEGIGVSGITTKGQKGLYRANGFLGFRCIYYIGAE